MPFLHCLRSTFTLSFLKKIYAAVLGHPVDMPGHSFLFTIFFTSCIPILSILHLSLRVKSLIASLNVWPCSRLAKLYSYKHLLLFSYFHCLWRQFMSYKHSAIELALTSRWQNLLSISLIYWRYSTAYIGQYIWVFWMDEYFCSPWGLSHSQLSTSS